jgi:hypothetical protein
MILRTWWWERNATLCSLRHHTPLGIFQLLVSWCVTPCCLMKVYRRFRGTASIFSIREQVKQQQTESLFGLIFDFEQESSTSARNFRKVSVGFAASHHEPFPWLPCFLSQILYVQESVTRLVLSWVRWNPQSAAICCVYYVDQWLRWPIVCHYMMPCAVLNTSMCKEMFFFQNPWSYE